MPIRLNYPWYYYLFLISVPFLFWQVIKNISLADTISTLSGIGFFNIVILVIVNIIIVFTMTARWWLLTVALGYKIPYISLIWYRLAGNAVSYFTPGPQFGGEPLQVSLLHRMRIDRMQKVPVEAATASVGMDRLMELVANFTILIIGSLFMINFHIFDVFFEKKALLLVCLLFILPAGVLWAVCSGKRPFGQFLGIVSRMYSSQGKNRSQRWNKIVDAICLSEVQAESLCLQKPHILFQAGLFSALNWACILSEFWLMFWFLGLTLTGIQLIIIVTAARFAFLTPLPGGIGALEISQVLIMESLGFNPALGLSACVIIRTRDLIVGCIGLWLTSVFMASINTEEMAK